MGGGGSDGEQSGSGGRSSSSSSEDDEPLSVGYKRRQALHMQQARQAERAQRALQRQQDGTPLRARKVAQQLAAAGSGSSDEDSLLGRAGIAWHARQRQVGKKRRYVSLLSSDEEEQQAEEHQQEGTPDHDGEDELVSSSEASQQRQADAAGQEGEAEEWSHGTDPDDSDSSECKQAAMEVVTGCSERAEVV